MPLGFRGAGEDGVVILWNRLFQIFPSLGEWSKGVRDAPVVQWVEASRNRWCGDHEWPVRWDMHSGNALDKAGAVL